MLCNHCLRRERDRALRGQKRPDTSTGHNPIKTRIPPVVSPSPAILAGIGLTKAMQLADSGKFAEAIKVCEAHLKEKGPTSEGYYLLGLTQDAVGDQQRAGECYRKALYLEPNHSEALMHLALLL